MPAGCAASADVIAGGLSAEAAVQRVAGELRDRMRRIADPYLRERLADLEDLAGTPASVSSPASTAAGRFRPARSCSRAGSARPSCSRGTRRGIAGVVIEEGSPAGHAAILARALGLPALGGARGVLDAAEPGDEAVLDADEGQLILRPEAEVKQGYRARPGGPVGAAGRLGGVARPPGRHGGRRRPCG